MRRAWLVLAATATLAAPAAAHPGGRDKQGCHVCRTNCAKHGVAEGVRHCHGTDGQVY